MDVALEFLSAGGADDVVTGYGFAVVGGVNVGSVCVGNASVAAVTGSCNAEHNRCGFGVLLLGSRCGCWCGPLLPRIRFGVTSLLSAVAAEVVDAAPGDVEAGGVTVAAA